MNFDFLCQVGIIGLASGAHHLPPLARTTKFSQRTRRPTFLYYHVILQLRQDPFLHLPFAQEKQRPIWHHFYLSFLLLMFAFHFIPTVFAENIYGVSSIFHWAITRINCLRIDGQLVASILPVTICTKIDFVLRQLSFCRLRTTSWGLTDSKT